MKGLLIKDFFALTKQLKIFLLIIVLFTFMQNSSTYSFAIVYSAMLPITALGYDERSKWNRLAAMMPYSTKSIVLRKYILGYICVAAAVILSIVVKFAFSIYKSEPFSTEIFMDILPNVCIATLFLAINLPFMFKMGVEKGRLIFFALIAIIIIGGVALKDIAAKWVNLYLPQADFISFIVVFLTFTILINLISIALSIRIYKHKEN